MSHATGTPPGGLPYENTAAQQWDEKARALYEGRQLQVAAFDGQGVGSVQVWGPCPRCGHDINVTAILTAPVTVAGLGGRGLWATLTGHSPRNGPAIPDEVEVGCGCGRVHPEAPERDDGHGKVPGCGVSFHLPTTPPAPSTSPNPPPPDIPREC